MSEATQADFLTKAFTRLQSYPYVKAAFWYNFRNTYWLFDDPAQYEANSGVVRTSFAAKPAYTALQEVTAAQAPRTAITPTTTPTTASTSTRPTAPISTTTTTKRTPGR